MNHHLHRIIFNARRGQLMVVGETASASGSSARGEGACSNRAGRQGSGGGDDRGSAPTAPSRIQLAVLMAWGMLVWGLPALHGAQAQIKADPNAPGNQRPTILSTANGLAQVNIQTPSAAGVSRNTYSQFDVPSGGVVLNNSRTNVQTQLGGFVAGNPWLATGPARVILNEVNSSRPSELRGYMEVAGQKAEVIVANPAGIMVDGGGVINASRLTLTTGTPVMNGGNLDSYRVQGGSITVNGLGLDAQGSDYTALLARAVQVNAGVWAHNLRVVTGANQFDAEQNTVTAALAGTGAVPAFALDVAQLGGMYAGKIFLIGTEAGLGVRNAGTLSAATGDLVLQANGWLSNSATLQASGNVQITTNGALANSGVVYASGNATLVSQGSMSNSGASAIVAAHGDTTLQAQGVGAQINGSAGSTIAAGLNADGSLSRTGLLSLNAADSVALHGQLAAGSDALVTGTQLNLAGASLGAQNARLLASTGSLNASGATLSAQDTLTLTTPQTLITDGAAVSAGQINITAQGVSNVAGQIVQLGTGNMALSLAANLDNTRGRIATNSQNLALSANTVVNTGGALLSNGNLALSAQSVNNQGGSIQASGASSLAITAALDNSASGHIASGGPAIISAGSLNNSLGQLTSHASLAMVVRGAASSVQGMLVTNGALTLSAASLDNTRGTLASVLSSVSVVTTGTTTNDNGRLQALGDVTLSNAGLSNSVATANPAASSAGTITGRTITLNTNGQAFNNAGGTVAASQGASFRTGSLNNDAGLIQTGAALSIDTNGQLLTNTNAALNVANHGGAPGGLSAQGALTLNTGDLNNTAGYVGAKGVMHVAAVQVSNTSGGQMVGESSIGLSSSGWDNRSGQVQALGDVTLTTGTGALNNAAGLIRSSQAVTLTGAHVINSNTLGANQGIEGNNVALNAPIIDNDSGAIRANNNVTLSSSGTVNNRAGLISAGQTLTIQDLAASRTLTLTNTAGTLIAGDSAVIRAAQASGDGRLLSRGSLTLSLVGGYTNIGEVIANGNASIEAAFVSNSGKLQSGRTLRVSAGDIDNAATGEMTGQTTQLIAVNTLTNRGLIDGQITQIDAATLTNIGSGRIYGDTLSIAAHTLTNDAELVAGSTLAATIAARQQLDIGAATVNNSNGALILSAGDLAIGATLDANRKAVGSAEAINNAASTLQAQGKLSLNAALINNINPGFAYNVAYSTGPAAKDFITGAGTLSSTDVGWVLNPTSYQTQSHGGTTYAGAQGRLLLGSHAYGNPVYQPYYSGANPHAAATATYDSEGNYTSVPETFNYASSSAVWTLFGVAAPTAPPPTGPRPTAIENPDTGYVTNPTPAQLAAWDRAAAPWLALQTKFDAFRSSVDASALSFSGFRDYTQQVPVANVTASTPGRILSGADMTLNARTALTNDQSQIIAGGALTITGQAVNNLARTTTVNAQRNGRAFAWSRFDHGCGNVKGCEYDYRAYRDSSYVQDVPQTLSLNTSVSRSSTAPNANATLLAPVALASMGAAASAPGAANAVARNAGIVQVSASVSSAGSAPAVIRSVTPDLKVSNASLFHPPANPGAHYLVETDPRFANLRQWLGSDYMLTALGYDPAAVQKRLGDAFYEQRLVREQVAELTGRRFLGDYASDQAQYQGLMNAGITFAKTYPLRPGIALSAQQMALLTSDMVWLVEQTVTLLDGSTAQALVPQLYARVQPGDLDGTGALLAGRSVAIQLTGDLTNTATLAATGASPSEKTLAGRNLLTVSALNVHNLGGRITGQSVTLEAAQDLANIGGQIDALDALRATAGRDLAITTTSATNQVGGNTFSLSGLDRLAGLYVNNAGGSLLASAGRDAAITAGVLQSQGSLAVTAGNNLNLTTVQTASANSVVRDAQNFLADSQSRDVGSQVSAADKLALEAGNDLTAKAATLSAGNTLSAAAGNSINLAAGQQTSSSAFGMSSSDSDLFSTTTTVTRQSYSSSAAQVSQLSGNNVAITAGQDLVSVGARFAAKDTLTVEGKNSQTFYAAKDVSQSSKSVESTTSMLGGLIGLGSSSSTDTGLKALSISSELQSTHAINVKVGNSASFEGAKLSAEQIAFIKTDPAKAGELVLGASVDTTQTSHTEKNQTLGVYQSQSGSGSTTQALSLTRLSGNVTIDQNLAVAVQLPKFVTTSGDKPNTAAAANTTSAANQASVQSQIDQLASQPGLAYLGQLSSQAAQANPVQWRQVQLAQDNWRYQSQGLTPAGAALLSIAVAAYTGGMGAEMLGGTSAAAATATTAASAATLMGSTALGAAANAGVASLAAQAAVAMVNNGGDIGKTLQQLGSSQSVKNLLTSIGTAGALDALGNSALFNGQSGAAATGTNSLSTAQTAASLGDKLLKNVTNNLAGAAIRSAINGQPFDAKALSGALTSALITAGMAQGANAIGDARVDSTLNDFTQKLAHAVLGCAGGAAAGGGCSAGAVGAVVGEMTAQYASDAGMSRENALALAKTLSAASGVLVGGGGGNAAAVNTAATTGANAAENNYLNHKDASRLLALQTKFNNGTLTTNEAQERSDLVQKDTTTNGQQLACTGSTTAACQIVKDDYAQAKQSFLPSQNDIQKWANDKAAGSPYTAGQLIDAYNFAFTKGAQPKTQTSTGDLSSAYDWIVNDLSATAKANGGADVTDKIYMGWATANAPSVAGGITSAILANQALSKVGGQVGAALGVNGGNYANREAQNIATTKALADDLRLQSANSPFAKNGALTGEAIDSAKSIPGLGPGELSNPAIPPGFGKYTTDTFQSPAGNFQVRFYKNPATGEVLYGLDYKAVFNNMSGVPKK